MVRLQGDSSTLQTASLSSPMEGTVEPSEAPYEGIDLTHEASAQGLITPEVPAS